MHKCMCVLCVYMCYNWIMIAKSFILLCHRLQAEIFEAPLQDEFAPRQYYTCPRPVSMLTAQQQRRGGASTLGITHPGCPTWKSQMLRWFGSISSLQQMCLWNIHVASRRQPPAPHRWAHTAGALRPKTSESTDCRKKNAKNLMAMYSGPTQFKK